MPKVPEQNKNNRALLVLMSIMSGIQVVAGGVVLVDVIPADVSGILFLVVGAVNAGVMYYINGNVVALKNVVAYQPNKMKNSNLYAGGASNQTTGNSLSVESKVGSLADRVVYEDTPYTEGTSNG